MENEIFFLEQHIDEASVNRLIQEIQKIRDSNDEAITLYICCPGGKSLPSIGFYDWVKVEKVKLTTIAIGHVSSSAIYIFLSGTKRKATSHSMFLIHPGGQPIDRIRNWLLRIVSPRHYRENRDFDSGIDRAGQDIIVKETKLAPAMVGILLARRHLLMTPKQAHESGFITEII